MQPSSSDGKMNTPKEPDDGTEAPVKSGERHFLRINHLFDEGESVTHRFDCNTVGPVPVASGYGSRTLTHSAVHVLDSSKDHASAFSSQCEKIHTQHGDNDLWELSFTGSTGRLAGLPDTIHRSAYMTERRN